MKFSPWVLLGAALLVAAPLTGQDTAEPKGARKWPLPRAEEVALAESAGPAYIVKDATIYALEKDGFVVARDGTNGFTCLVARSQPDTQEPMCFDKEGAAALLPKILDDARYRAQGMSPAEVQQKLAEGFLSGKYRAPRRAVISYMLSCENWVPVSAMQAIPYPPHLMFYVPNLTSADIGGNSKDPWMPFVVNAGSPHAIVIIRTGEDPNAPRCP